MTILHPSRRPTARSRRAFTLTEMLVVIMIIALLSSMVLFAMASVQEQTREKRTRAQIARLHESKRIDLAKCVACGSCVEACPQDIPVPERMGRLAALAEELHNSADE